MKTTSSLCGTASATALSALGLAVARHNPDYSPSDSLNNHTSRDAMIATTYTITPPHSSSFAYAPTTAQPQRLVSESDNNGRSRASSPTRPVMNKRHSFTPSTSGFSAGMDKSLRREEQQGRGVPPDTLSSGPPPNSTWLRRLSSSLSTSRDSTRTLGSRPGSATLSYTNGSSTFSQSGSTTPIIQEGTSPHTALGRPNKLVKRTSSIRSVGESPGSRIPVFRRPATSHQRSITLQEDLSVSKRSGRKSLARDWRDNRDPSWRSYFIPRVAAEQIAASRRHSTTGIPNPIRRVYPDRKYTPVLVSAKEVIPQPAVEFDDETSEHSIDAAVTDFGIAASSASSPLPPQIGHFETTTSPRRSFSIGDLLSTGPQPLWRRPSGKGRPRSSRSTRRPKARVVSEPQTSMGNDSSRLAGYDSERPAKRRELTDPTTSQRSIYSSPRSNTDREAQFDTNRNPRNGESLIHKEASTPQPPSRTQTPDQSVLTSATPPSSSANPTRTPASQSPFTSSVASDAELGSMGDNSTDYQSDAYYDSLPTRTTRSSSGRRGPHIETLFDDSPPNFSSGRSTKLRDFLSDGQENSGRYSTIEEEGSVVSTPVKSIRNRSVASTPSARPGASHLYTSSPPMMATMPDPDDMDWDAKDDDSHDRGLGVQQQSSIPSFTGTPSTQGAIPFRFGPTLRPNDSHAPSSTPHRNGHSPLDKASLFDWAEPQPSPSHPNNSPPRPRTVHGKKDQDSRGSRPVGRRHPSGMHARSHSVPVVPDFDGKRSNVVANKFGTWGVGSKGVTEDWNEDFDFEELPIPVPSATDGDERRIDSGHAMFVPKSIREQQQNVVANIGLLREWGLLIEELKELRLRAVTLNMLNGPHAQAWKEVDAMIELADQETEEHTLEPRRTPPSSPGFDHAEFEDATPSRANGLSQQSSLRQPVSDPLLMEHSPKFGKSTNSTNASPLVTRPRKDSELVAQSVIAALQSKQSMADAAATQPGSSTAKKVPFDTATLRHIVPYVSGLKRRVKEAVRETEGLYSSPHRRRSPAAPRQTEEQSEGEPAFRSMFNSPQGSDDITTQRQSRRDQGATDHDGSDSSLFDQSGRLANRLQQMSLPS